MNFARYNYSLEEALRRLAGKEAELAVADVNPVCLAYVGDSVYSLYFRSHVLRSTHHVRVLHNMDAQMVSAVYQAKVLHALEVTLTEAEKDIVRRGRNTKSAVPSSASVGEYRAATALEALIGYLYVTGARKRMEELLGECFALSVGILRDARNEE